MKRILYLFNFLMLVALGTQASEKKETTSFEDIPDEVIQNVLMKKLEDKDFVHFVKASKRILELANPELEKRRMLKQRADFKRRLSENNTELSFRGSNLKLIYKGVFDDPTFNNLRTLDLSKNYLTQLDTDTFKNLKSLIRIELSYNELKLLDKDIFRGLTNLVRINVDHNNLTSLNKEMFRGLRNLYFLDISRNRLTNDNIRELKSLIRNVINDMW